MRRLLVIACCLVVGGCAAPVPTSAPTRTLPATTAPPSTTAAPAPSATEAPTATAATEPCLEDAAALSLDARIGQLIMVGVDGGLDAAERRAITDNQIGSVVLLGTQNGGSKATADLVAEIAGLNLDVGMLAAADQEGGRVQRLTGTGFARIPSAATQAKLPLDKLTTSTRVWARRLTKADIGLDLAPVADVVPASKVKSNAPIGRLGRGYGSDPEAVTARTQAVITGLADEGVAATVKHFPGLGEVTGNTDHTGGVVDRVTRADSASLAPFKAAVEGQVGAVMISSATYTRIDASHQAVFSPKVIGLLRQWGYRGVVISDDLGAAASVASVPAAQRAVRFLAAGGDLVINANPGLTAAMVGGVRKRAKADAAFSRQLTASAARVLALKETVGRYTCG
ncbi:MAG TPA: glycoside hydrolase family 3 N-terminal domain-containing protein [Propionicimonas sp.]|nr:glycoside hydrolase family 3 N-terminal domain-containing protein [Propionicimonas sp.]